MKLILILFLALWIADGHSQNRNKNNKAIFLEDISWTEAQKVLKPDVLIVIPLGAAAKEHGPHLPLATDFIQAEGLRDLVALERKFIIAPVVSYGFYPAFVKYPGSTTTYWNTSRNMVLEIVRTLSSFGPRRFYIINIGVSTTPTLAAAAALLREEGIILYYSDYFRKGFAESEKGIATEDIYGGHADEMETSNVLHFRNNLVHMERAANDSSVKDKRGPMTPVPLQGGTLNTTGINGYAKLATKKKGERYAKMFAKELIREMDSVAQAELPLPRDNKDNLKIYEGEYEHVKGKKMIIGQEGGHLFYIWDGLDQRAFYPLHENGADEFSAVPLDVIFIRNNQGKVVNARCNYRGEVFWMDRK